LWPIVCAGILWIFGRRLRRLPGVLAAYLTGSAALFAFSYFLYAGFLKHHGYHFLLGVACLWLAWQAERPTRAERLALALWFAVSAATGAYVWMRDFRDPFSVSSKAAAFIRSEGLDRLPMIGAKDYGVMPLAAHLRRRIYYAQSGESGTFVRWTARRDWGRLPMHLDRAARRVLAEDPEALLVLTFPIRTTPQSRIVAEPIRQIRGSIVWEEDYYLYRLRRIEDGRPSVKGRQLHFERLRRASMPSN
jgi:hypothetical protein